MTILEQGKLTNENLEAVIEQVVVRSGVRRAVLPDTDVQGYTAWWKCRDENGQDFLYFGTPESFARFQKERVN